MMNGLEVTQITKALLLFTAMVIGMIQPKAQAPNISYPSISYTFPVNKPISQLMPNNAGGAVSAAGSIGMVTTFAGSRRAYADGTGTAASFSWPAGVALDNNGNVYVSEMGNHRIRKISPAGVVTTLAGNGCTQLLNGYSTGCYADGISTSASFNGPKGVVADASGNVYIDDTYNHRIRKISPSGAVTTIAGIGYPSYGDGNGTSAGFFEPNGATVDGSGNLYVADQYNHSIRKISQSGVVTTFAGNGNFGYVDGTGSVARFAYPTGVAADRFGNVYVADQLNQRIRKISPLGKVSTLAGSGNQGYADGPDTAAKFNYPYGIAVDGIGNVYVSEYYNHRIRKISPAGLVSTLAGSGNYTYADGIGTAASFNYPTSLAVDDSGKVVYVADQGNDRIRKISCSGGYTVYPALPAGLSLNTNTGVISGVPTVITPVTNYVVTATNDSGSYSFTLSIAIRTAMTISSFTPTTAATGTTVTIKGIHFTGAMAVSFGTELATSFKVLDSNTITAVVGKGVSGNVVVTTVGETASLRGFTYLLPLPSITYSPSIYNFLLGTAIAPLTPTNTGGPVAAPGTVNISVVSTVAGNGINDYVDGTGTAARFSFTAGVSVDGNCNIYVGDTYNNRIRKINPLGVVTTFAGNSNAGLSNGQGSAASFSNPRGVALDSSGNVYVADRDNNCIRKISPSGIVTTLAGNGSYGYADGTGSAASFDQPTGVAVDSNGNVYVADSYNMRIRKISPTGMVTTLAGSGKAAYIDGIGTAASFVNPYGVSVDRYGNVFVADSDDNRIRKISPTGMVTTLAGSGNAAYSDGIGIAASFNGPRGLKVDTSGNVYVADTWNSRIRKISPSGVVTTIAGSGNVAYTDGIGTAASFSGPASVDIDSSGSIYVADFYNYRIRKISRGGGYTVNPLLPAGLSLNAATGVISGTPTIITPATNYTITATNDSGSNSFKLTIATIAAPTITSFTPTNATTGTIVTITGTNLTGATAVSFGGVVATLFKVFNSNTIKAYVGNGASGDVSVTTASGTATKAGFIYSGGNNHTLFGSVKNQHGSTVPNVTTLLNGASPQTVSGNFNYSVAATGTYTIRVSKDNDVKKTNGISALDVLYIQAHVLNKIPLSTPYKLIAADVNGDNKVSTLDMLYTKRLVLGIDTTFKGNRLWAFVDSAYVFPDPAVPFPFKDSLTVTDPSTDITGLSFTGIKLGDVNNDWNATVLGKASPKNRPVVLIYTRSTANGNELRVPVRVKDFRSLLGLQFTLNFDANAWQWKGIENNLLGMEYGQACQKEGKLSFLWTDQKLEAKTLADGMLLMTLVFESAGRGATADLQMTSDIAAVEAWDANFGRHEIALEAIELQMGAPGIETFTISPNPTDGRTVLQLNLKQAKTLEIGLTDAEGRCVYRQTITAPKGNSKVPIDFNRSGTLPSGTYYLRLNGLEGGNVRKLIVQ